MGRKKESKFGLDAQQINIYSANYLSFWFLKLCSKNKIVAITLLYNQVIVRSVSNLVNI